jgi:hypothetical protein
MSFKNAKQVDGLSMDHLGIGLYCFYSICYHFLMIVPLSTIESFQRILWRFGQTIKPLSVPKTPKGYPCAANQILQGLKPSGIRSSTVWNPSEWDPNGLFRIRFLWIPHPIWQLLTAIFWKNGLENRGPYGVS